MSKFSDFFKKLFGRGKKPSLTPYVPPVVTSPTASTPTTTTASVPLWTTAFPEAKPWVPETYPRVLVRNGVSIMANAWIAEDWLPSMEAHVFGQGGKVLSDPSNAPEGFALRTPNAYPLVYALDIDKRPVGNPRVSFNGVTLDSEKDIIRYIAAVKDRDENLANWEKTWINTFYGGPFASTSLSQVDAEYLFYKSMEYAHEYAVKYGHSDDLHRIILSGSNQSIAQAINAGGTSPGGYNSQTVANYNGMLKATVEAVFANLRAGTPTKAVAVTR